MKTKKLQEILYSLVFIFTISNINAQLVVDGNTGIDISGNRYANIQDAVDAAVDGDTIYVQPLNNGSGVYDYATINKNIHIVGKSHNGGQFRSAVTQINVEISTTGVTIRGMYFSVGVTLRGTDPVIEDCRSPSINMYNDISSSNITDGGLIKGCIADYITVSKPNVEVTNTFIIKGYSTYYPDLTVLRNSIITSASTTFYIQNRDTSRGNMTIQNCMFLADSSSDFTLNPSYTAISNCVAYNYGSGNLILGTNTQLTFTDMVEADPLLTNIIGYINNAHPDNNYILQSGSPAIGAGLNGEDIGLLGGQPNFTFRGYGYPHGYPTTQITSSTAGVPQGGLLHIEFTGTAR